MVIETKEFIGERAQLYADVLRDFPTARAEEVEINMSYLKPKEQEKILEIGSGSGLYTKAISQHLDFEGELVATDPSADQLENLRKLNCKNVRVIQAEANKLLPHPELEQELESFDAIWSLGAFHHCPDKSAAFTHFNKLLKKGGRMLLCDVFSGSNLANYFDAEVARFSVTGHEVAFLTHEFSRSLCYLYGFAEPVFHNMDFLWKFKSREDLGTFMYKIHGMTKTTPEKCLLKVEELMDVETIGDEYVLHVPLTILETQKI